MKEEEKKKYALLFSTYGSQVVPHLSTRHAQWCLTSEFEWDLVFPPWYDRMTIGERKIFCTQHMPEAGLEPAVFPLGEGRLVH